MPKIRGEFSTSRHKEELTQSESYLARLTARFCKELVHVGTFLARAQLVIKIPAEGSCF